jgi:hypothetical protein
MSGHIDQWYGLIANLDLIGPDEPVDKCLEPE